MPEVPKAKTLSPFEQKMLALLLEKLKPQIDAAVEGAKVKLRDAIGPEGLVSINKAVVEIEKIAVHGLPPLPPKLITALTDVVKVANALGLTPAAHA